MLLAAMFSACASQTNLQVQQDAREISQEMLLETGPLALQAKNVEFEETSVLDLSPEMESFLDSITRSSMSEATKVRQLVYALTTSDRFEMIYDDQTRTAMETFRDGRGNCLSFTNMFVAMARYLRLKASYQEVEIPPDWSSAGEVLVISRHINVFIEMNPYSDRVIDFNTEVVSFKVHDLMPTYKRQVVSDQRAHAHYYNNIGVEQLLLKADPLSAFLNVRQSLIEDQTFSSAWISLGILNRRAGYLGYSEAAFMKALEFEPRNLVAMSNLASLYELQGLTEKTELYRAKVRSHRMRNPYYRYELAKESFLVGDYPDAVSHLKFAVRKRPLEGEFHALLGMSYLMQGDRAEALLEFEQAENLTTEESERQRYQRKVDLLLN